MISDFKMVFPSGTVEYINVIWQKDRVAAETLKKKKHAVKMLHDH